MLMQAANIVDNACKMIRDWPDRPEFRLAGLKCIEAIVLAGVGLPIQYTQTIVDQITGEDESCAAAAQRIYDSQFVFPRQHIRPTPGDVTTNV